MRMLGFAPIQEMVDAGICVSIGTDGAPSNNRMSIGPSLAGYSCVCLLYSFEFSYALLFFGLHCCIPTNNQIFNMRPSVHRLLNL